MVTWLAGASSVESGTGASWLPCRVQTRVCCGIEGQWPHAISLSKIAKIETFGKLSACRIKCRSLSKPGWLRSCHEQVPHRAWAQAVLGAAALEGQPRAASWSAGETHRR